MNEYNSQQTVRLLKIIIALSIVVYFGMTFLLKHYVFMGDDNGFVYAPDAPEARQLLYIFAGISAFNFVFQFFITQIFSAKTTTQQGSMGVAVLRIAICESIAVLGFLTYLLSGLQVESWIFMGTSLIALLFGDRKVEKAL